MLSNSLVQGISPNDQQVHIVLDVLCQGHAKSVHQATQGSAQPHLDAVLIGLGQVNAGHVSCLNMKKNHPVLVKMCQKSLRKGCATLHALCHRYMFEEHFLIPQHCTRR